MERTSCARAAMLIVALLFFLNTTWAQPQPVRTDVLVEDSRIGLVQGVAVDTDQNVYVGDLLNTTVHRYTRDGTYDRSFGRRGRGPGEFRGVTGIRIGPADSLYVHDRQARRVTVFATDLDADPRTLRLPAGPEEKGLGVTGGMITGFDGLWLTSEGRPLVVYEAPMTPMEGAGEGRQLEVRFGDASSGSEPVLRIRDEQMLHLKGAGQNAATYRMPFGGKPDIEMGPDDRIYFGYSQELTIRRASPGGTTATVVSHDFPRVEVTEALLKSEIERMSYFGDVGILRKAFDTVQEKVPSRIPAFEDFAVDDEGRVWVAVNTRRALEEGYTEYWIFGPEGTLLREISFDRLVFLKAFGEKHAYGIATKPNGKQRIVRAPLVTLLP